VTRKEVDASLGVVYRNQKVSKAILTTASTFAPGVMTSRSFARLMRFDYARSWTHCCSAPTAWWKRGPEKARALILPSGEPQDPTNCSL
jgi:hypothetical protein